MSSAFRLTQNNTRRALIGGALALPFIKRADAQLAARLDSWRQGFKPVPAAEFAQNGRLSANLRGLVLFEHCAKAGFIDYVQPNNAIAFTGTSQAATTSPFGGQALSTNGNNNDWVAYATAFPATAVWSFTSMIKFDGTGAGSFAFSPNLVVNGARSAGIGVTGSGADTFNWTDGTGTLTPAVTTWTTWTRLTFTSNGTSVSMYANGALQSSASPSTTNFAAQILCNSWPWAMSDFIWWQGRTLTAQDVAALSADPFGTTMRPKQDTLRRVGQIIGKKPSLLVTGVGP